MQVFSKCAQVRDTVGLANCGISSSVAKDMHKKQGIYGVLVILTAAAQLTALQNDISSVLSAVAAAMAALEGFRLATFLKAVQLYCSVGVCWYGTATSPRMICQLK